MKVRNGFVSNSSSSSFLIYGMFLDCSEIAKILNLEEMSSYEIIDELEKRFGKSRITFSSPEDCGGVYIGASWDSIRDDELGKSFKDSIEKEIKNILPTNKNCTTLEHSWYNG